MTKRKRRNGITLILLSSLFFLLGCSKLPFFSKRQESEEIPRETLVVEALEKNQLELSSKHDQLKAELEALKVGIEESTADVTTSKSRIEALTKKTDQLEAELAEVRTGLAAVGKLIETKLAEIQKKNEASLTQVREDIQRLLTKHDQIEASLKDVQESVKQTEASLKEITQKRQPTKKAPR